MLICAARAVGENRLLRNAQIDDNLLGLALPNDEIRTNVTEPLSQLSNGFDEELSTVSASLGKSERGLSELSGVEGEQREHSGAVLLHVLQGWVIVQTQVRPEPHQELLTLL